METQRFIFIVDTENHLNMLTRIAGHFSRKRISIHELQTNLNEAGNKQRFVITISETKENAIKLCRQIEKQVDVLSVNLFGQLYKTEQ